MVSIKESNVRSCFLEISSPTILCDPFTPNNNTPPTYTVRIPFAEAAVYDYTITTEGVGVIGGDDPDIDANGTIIISEIPQGTNFIFEIRGGVCYRAINVESPSDSNCYVSSCANLGDVIISEIMQDPNSVNESNGEWFEIYNTTNTMIDINGWVIEDGLSNTHTIAFSAPYFIMPNEYLVLGINSDSNTNGGVPINYQYGNNISLGNNTGQISLFCSGSLIDDISYNTSNFPYASGTSMELSVTTLTGSENNLGTNWGLAISVFGNGDLGTPGAINDFNETLSTSNYTSNSFSIYPNPVSTGFITIASNNSFPMQITIFDVLGKKVLTQSIKDNRLDIQNLKTGIYIIKIIQDNATATKKLIIK